MRIISGEFGGRPLKAVPGSNTRPTTDKIKESLFNLLGKYFDGGVMLDMYAGSGGIGIEAVSRGIDHAFLCENNRQAIETIQANIAMTRAPQQFSLLKQNVHIALKSLKNQAGFAPLSLVFMDPPYKKEQIEKDIQTLQDLDLLSPQAVLVAEIDKSHHLADQIGEFEKVRRVEYGITALVFFERKED